MRGYTYQMIYKEIHREKGRTWRLIKGFFLPQITAYFEPQTQRGGCNIKKRLGVTSQLSLNSFVFMMLLTTIRFPYRR